MTIVSNASCMSKVLIFPVILDYLKNDLKSLKIIFLNIEKTKLPTKKSFLAPFYLKTTNFLSSKYDFGTFSYKGGFHETEF